MNWNDMMTFRDMPIDDMLADFEADDDKVEQAYQDGCEDGFKKGYMAAMRKLKMSRLSKRDNGGNMMGARSYNVTELDRYGQRDDMGGGYSQRDNNGRSNGYSSYGERQRRGSDGRYM